MFYDPTVWSKYVLEYLSETINKLAASRVGV